MVIFGVILRILSNSYLNVFQKLLTKKGSDSSVVNFYSFLGMTIIGILCIPFIYFSIPNSIYIDVIVMGILGALGNLFIIKALSLGDLSSLSAINSYKPVVALIGAIFFIREIPSVISILGIALIIMGTYFISKSEGAFNKKAVFYRFLGLIFSGTEAVFIKKIILATNVPTSFILWAFAGMIFSLIFALTANKKLKCTNVKYQLALVGTFLLMQYSTNYVFSVMNVSSALALFQLSILLNVFLGVNIFKEKDFVKRILSSIVMVLGAVILIIYN